MEYIACAFRSRSDAVAFSAFLKSHGVNAEIISTPKEAGVGCGLSVKTQRGMLSLIKNALRAANLKSFAGFFLVTSLGGKRFVKSI